jgi:hypothetical protein
MWRNQFEGSRDMYLTESRDGGNSFSEAVKIGLGTWPLKGCPMDGGAVSARAGQVSTIWRRGGEIYRAAAGKEEELLGSGVQPWGALTGRGAFFVWIDRRPGDLHLLTPESRSSRIIATNAADPAIAAAVKGSGPIVAVWESVGAVFAAPIK